MSHPCDTCLAMGDSCAALRARVAELVRVTKAMMVHVDVLSHENADPRARIPGLIKLTLLGEKVRKVLAALEGSMSVEGFWEDPS